MLKDKKIILGITGSIAAYKAATLTRLLVKEGAYVKIIVTPLAKEFITPVTLATLSKNTVLCDFFHHSDGAWNSHVELGLWADLMLIAPATANSLAKMAHGICDNLLLTTYLSVRCPVMIAPAMDTDMFQHPATLKNINILKTWGNLFVESPAGELASGLHGKGRMEEPEKILSQVINFFKNKETLKGKKYLVTAGPTYENIDPVRFIGNYSSGKMGYAIAETLAEYGASVTLISGPVHIQAQHTNIKTIQVNTAEEMFNASVSNFKTFDGAILAAAVADFSPILKSSEKIKRNTSTMLLSAKKEKIHLELVPTKDIAATLGKQKTKKQITVGFALESNDEIKNARIKLIEKNFDFIVLNSLNDKGAGFNHDTNKISIINKNNKIETFELKSKIEVANDIVKKIISLYK